VSERLGRDGGRDVKFWKTMQPIKTDQLPWIRIPTDPQTCKLVAERIDVIIRVAEVLNYDEYEMRFWQTLREHVIAIGERVQLPVPLPARASTA
jgi:hypothetical protein